MLLFGSFANLSLKMEGVIRSSASVSSWDVFSHQPPLSWKSLLLDWRAAPSQGFPPVQCETGLLAHPKDEKEMRRVNTSRSANSSTCDHAGCPLHFSQVVFFPLASALFSLGKIFGDRSRSWWWLKPHSLNRMALAFSRPKHSLELCLKKKWFLISSWGMSEVRCNI